MATAYSCSNFFDGRWHLTDAVEKYRAWQEAIGRPELTERLFLAAMNLAEHRRGGMFVVLENPGRTAAAIGASQFGEVLMISEGGQLSFYRKSHSVWTL